MTLHRLTDLTVMAALILASLTPMIPLPSFPQMEPPSLETEIAKQPALNEEERYARLLIA